MSSYAVIVENDETKWNDNTGEYYHFPKRYLNILEEGTKVLYYKGKMRNFEFKEERLSSDPHYFGIGKVKKFFPDERSSKGDYYASITDFQRFREAVSFKDDNGEYLENIPENRESNYWRDGVREISEEVYQKVLNLAQIDIPVTEENNNDITNESENLTSSNKEGNKKKVYTTRYERDPKLREDAIEIHGLSCQVCDFNFEEVYGDHGSGFIHVHHKEPLSETNGEQDVDPKEDLSVLCPNCHSMIHRYRDKTLTVEELKGILNENEGQVNLF